MLDFFIALFGITYYGARVAGEKIGGYSAKMEQEKIESIRNIIDAIYCPDEDFDAKVSKYIGSGEHYDELCSEFGEELKYILGEDIETFRLPKVYSWDNCRIDSTDYYRHKTLVYHLLLAKYGKIDKWIAFHGFEFRGTECRKDVLVRLAECMEHRLIDTGVSLIKFALDTEGGKIMSADDYRAKGLVIECLSRTPTIRIWEDYCPKLNKPSFDDETSNVALIDVFKEMLLTLPVDVRVVKTEDHNSKWWGVTTEFNGTQHYTVIRKKEYTLGKAKKICWERIVFLMRCYYNQLGDDKKGKAWKAASSDRNLIPSKKIDVNF